MKTVLVTDHAWPSLEIEREVLAEAGAVIVAAETGAEAELVGLAGAADAIMTCWRPVTPAVLRAAPHCHIVARYGVGLDNIAVSEATELGMVVTNVPDFCVDEVADHALALILALARHIVPFSRQTRSGLWDNQAAGPMHRLRGRTLGVVGFGRVGMATAARAHAFGMRLVAYGPRLTPETCAAAPFPVAWAASLEELLEAADVVSLHVPLTPETRALIGARELARMKSTSLLVNTCRGAVVDADALAGALRAGRIAGAGVDVLAQEPPDPADPLLGLDNVIVTPHAAFFSEESTAELQRRAAECVVAALRGEVPPSIVNPTVLDRSVLRMSLAGPASR